MATVKKEFFTGTTIAIAQRLLGAYLLHSTKFGNVIGRIVETEAYLHQRDPASHAFRGKTKRNAVMFGPPGHAYVYFIYGMHYCFNVVTAPDEHGEAVLIRSLEPVRGIDAMRYFRGVESVGQLCNGPGKLAKALNLNLADNGKPLWRGPLRILRPDSFLNFAKPPRRSEIQRTTRIGISSGVDLPLRFYLKSSSHVSRTL